MERVIGKEFKMIPRYVERALELCVRTQYFPIRLNANALAGSIIEAFVWEHSPQGHDFWDEAHARLLDENEPTSSISSLVKTVKKELCKILLMYSRDIGLFKAIYLTLGHSPITLLTFAWSSRK